MNRPASPPSMISDLRTLPRTFWILFAGTFINRFGTFVWPFLTIYLTRQGHSLGAAALAVSAVGGGALLGNVVGGWMTDRIGRRDTIVIGTFASAVFVMLLYAAQTLPMTILAAALLGVANGSYHPAASALLADIVPDGKRIRAYSAFRLAANAGFACGAFVGGLLANYSTFWLFAGDALTTVGYGFIALFLLPHGLREQTKNAPWSETFVYLQRDRAFHVVWFGAFSSAIIFAQVASTYSLYIIQEKLTFRLLGMQLAPEAVYGLLIAWNGLLIVCAELPLTAWTLRFKPHRVMALGYVLIGAGFGMNAWAHQLPMLFFAMTIFTVGEMISSPTTSALIANLAPRHMRGRYMGTLGLAWNSASIVAPLLGFRLFALDPRLIWTGSFAIGVFAAVLVLRSRAFETASALTSEDGKVVV